MNYKPRQLIWLTSVFLVIGAFLLFFQSLHQPPKPVPYVGESSNSLLFSFAAVGDFGANKNTRATLGNIYQQKVDFTLALGDFSYGQTKHEQAWCDLVTSRVGNEHPFELVAGNHDVELKNGRPVSGYIDEFVKCLPNRIPNIKGVYGEQYYFDYANAARFIAVSPALQIKGKLYEFKKGDAEYRWLASVIDEAHKKSFKWIIVAMHENCITVGTKECTIGTDILNLLVNKKVDLILQGHEHNYIRSKQLVLSNDCPKIMPHRPNGACVIEEYKNNTFKYRNGSIIVINGSGGVELRDINANREEIVFFSDWHGQNTQPTYGPSIFRVHKDRLEAFFISNQGRVEDHFTIKN